MPETKAFWREMLDYEWGNPSTMMFPGEEQEGGGGEGSEPNSETDPAQQIMDHYASSTHQTNFSINIDQNNTINHHHHLPPTHQQPSAAVTTFSHHHFNHHHPQAHLTSPTFYYPRADVTGSHYAPQPGHHQYPLLSLDPTFSSVGGGGDEAHGFLLVPKNEDVTLRTGAGPMDFASRIGLNLGGRTYFSSSEDDFVSRLYRRSRPAQDPASSNSPRCQAEGCNADMTHAKHYHRRHKVCEFHSKASAVIAAGLTQRFCQQCSRFHVLAEFDNGKRSCRKRLADHNRRRRKNQLTNPENAPKSQLDHNAASPSDHSTPLSRSPADSGAHSTSSVTVAMSPPRMTLDCFQQRTTYPAAATASSASSSSLFFSGS